MCMTMVDKYNILSMYTYMLNMCVYVGRDYWTVMQNEKKNKMAAHYNTVYSSTPFCTHVESLWCLCI